MQVWDAPRGNGPYGIALTPQGTVWYVSLAGNYLAEIDRTTRHAAHRRAADAAAGRAPRVVRQPGTAVDQRMEQRQRLHARPASTGAGRSWKKWKLPGERPRCYSVYVDDRDAVWLTDFAANAIVRFDPKTETFLSFPSDKSGANVRQMAGRPGEAWGGEFGTNRLVVIDKPQA